MSTTGNDKSEVPAGGLADSIHAKGITGLETSRFAGRDDGLNPPATPAEKLQKKKQHENKKKKKGEPTDIFAKAISTRALMERNFRPGQTRPDVPLNFIAKDKHVFVASGHDVKSALRNTACSLDDDDFAKSKDGVMVTGWSVHDIQGSARAAKIAVQRTIDECDAQGEKLPSFFNKQQLGRMGLVSARDFKSLPASVSTTGPAPTNVSKLDMPLSDCGSSTHKSTDKKFRGRAKGWRPAARFSDDQARPKKTEEELDQEMLDYFDAPQQQ